MNHMCRSEALLRPPERMPIFVHTEEVRGSKPRSPTIVKWPLTSGNAVRGRSVDKTDSGPCPHRAHNSYTRGLRGGVHMEASGCLAAATTRLAKHGPSPDE